ncbi:MAG: hypothetical protein D6795_15790, partial [Deltaproteobacteria bacterium]
MDDAFDDLLPPPPSRPSLPERLDAWTYLLFKGIVLALLFVLLGWLAMVLPPRGAEEWRWVGGGVVGGSLLFLYLLRRRIPFSVEVLGLLTLAASEVFLALLLWDSQRSLPPAGVTVAELAGGCGILIVVLLCVVSMRAVPKGVRWGMLLLAAVALLPFGIVLARNVPYEALATSTWRLPFPVPLVVFYGLLPLWGGGMIVAGGFQMLRGAFAEGTRSLLLGVLAILPALPFAEKDLGLLQGFRPGLTCRTYGDATFGSLLAEGVTYGGYRSAPEGTWAEWQGELYAPLPGTYAIGFRSRGDAELFVQNRLLVEGGGEKFGETGLERGWHPLHFLHTARETQGIQLLWRLPGHQEPEPISPYFFRTKGLPRSPRDAAQLGLSWLSAAAAAWDREHRCYGCHVQAVTAVGIAVGKTQGYTVDPAILTQMMDRIVKAELPSGGIGDPRVVEVGTAMATHAFVAYGRHIDDRYEAHLDRALDFLEGRTFSVRDDPPIVQGEIAVTAQYLLGLEHRFQRTGENRILARIEDVREELLARPRKTTQDHAFSLLALCASPPPAGGEEDPLEGRIGELLALQNDDGGWS